MRDTAPSGPTTAPGTSPPDGPTAKDLEKNWWDKFVDMAGPFLDKFGGVFLGAGKTALDVGPPALDGVATAKLDKDFKEAASDCTASEGKDVSSCALADQLDEIRSNLDKPEGVEAARRYLLQKARDAERRKLKNAGTDGALLYPRELEVDMPRSSASLSYDDSIPPPCLPISVPIEDPESIVLVHAGLTRQPKR